MKYTSQSIQQQIEAYLRQEMTDLERSGFERRMHDDAELHEEVQKQEAIIGAIRQERTLALKSSLQNVGVSLWSATLMEVARIAAVSIGIGLASAGAYWYYHNDNVQDSKMEVQNTTIDRQNTVQPTGSGLETKSSSETGNVNSEQEDDQAVNQGNREESGPKPEVLSAGPEFLQAEKSREAGSLRPTQKENQSLPENELLEPMVKTGQPETLRDPGSPEDGLSSKTQPESLQPEVIFKRDNKEKFHYQFSDGKLVLYADFSDKLYEVLELNQYGQRQLYLAYDGKFFILDPLVAEISPLREVKDNNLIQILSVYQKRK